MKKVLVIGHFWPYHAGGSKRMLGLAKYLPEFGWEPVIVSGDFQGDPDIPCRVVKTPSSNAIVSFKKMVMLNPGKGIQEQLGVAPGKRNNRKTLLSIIIRFIEGIITYPDVEKGWVKYAYGAAEKVLAREHMNAMISVWPIPAHLIARKIKDKYRIPWIADFPDLWAETYAYRYGSLRKFLDRRIEKKTLARADYLTDSSRPLEEVLIRMHPGKATKTITIGFDPDRINNPPKPLTKKFTITYTGIFYGEERNPSKFLQAFGEMMREGSADPNDFEVRFFSPKEAWVEQEIAAHGLSGIVWQCGMVPWTVCLDRQRESQLLLQLNWENKNEKGAYSGKIAEYLAAMRPILCVGGFGGDVMEDLFRETKVGYYCPTVQETKDALLALYAEYKKTGSLEYRGDSMAVHAYSYREMSRKFASILNSIEHKA